MGVDHAENIPGLRIIGTQFDRLLEVLACVFKDVSPQIERAQVVMGFGIIGFGGDDLLERRLCLLQIPVLKEGHSLSEVIALEPTLEESSGKRQRLLYA